MTQPCVPPLSLALSLLWPALSLAQPAAQPPPTASPALNAAYGTPPPGAQYDPSTTGDPGLVEQRRPGAADQIYKSSAQTTDAEGNPIGAGVSLEDMSGYMPESTIDDAPEFHVVQKGDTLWDISSTYLRDPYLWPKLWSYNDHVTNAHWIFPGDRIRLSDPYGRPTDGSGAGRIDEGKPRLRFSKAKGKAGGPGETYVLNQYAYVDAKEFELAMKVIGGTEAKAMMATLDTLYMSYERENPPIPGERLVVYTPQEPVRDFKNKEVIGWVVQVVGEVEIDHVARKAVEGTVAQSFNPVERGYRVGPLRRKFRRIDTVEAERSEVGTIVATISTTPYVRRWAKRRKSTKVDQKDQVAGEDHFVVLDIGANKSVRVGNVLDVVRKGDELTDQRAFKIPYEDGWPRRIIGTLLIVEVQERSSLAVVTFAARELERGDHAELRGSALARETERDEQEILRNADARGEARTGRGRTKAAGSLELGTGNDDQ